jgi:hypothetical protein
MKFVPRNRQRFHRRDAMATTTAETPEALMVRALEGRLTKHALASFLTPEAQPAFLRACASIEQRLTEACSSAGDPCLESGCSCEGDVCLQPMLRAGTEYLRACGAEWVKFFADAHNRERTWRRTAANYEIDPL